MIKLSFITGVNYPKFSEYGDINFTLAHEVLRNKAYTRYYKQKGLGKYTIIDNSAAELGQSIDIKDVVHAAKLVGADEIWCPDKLYDKKATIKMTKDFIDYLAREGYLSHFVLVGLPQGKNFKEWIECYKWMLDNDFIDIIAISKYSVECFNDLAGTKNFAICRKKAVEWLHLAGLIKKQLHCAGANNLWIDEIKYYNENFPMVRSMDSNIAFKLGVNKIKIEDCIWESTERLNHDVKDLSRLQLATIKHNISKIKGESR